MSNLTVFEQKYLAQFQKLGELKKEIERLTELDKSIRQELEQAMDDNNVISIKNDYVAISRVAASESVSVDLKALEAKEPDLYKDLVNDYPKITTRKASIRISVK